MHSKKLIISSIITVVILATQYTAVVSAFEPYKAYEVYVDDESIGLISNLNIIDEVINAKRQVLEEEFGDRKIYDPTNYYISTDISLIKKETNDEEVQALLYELLDFSIDAYYYTITPNAEKIADYNLNDVNRQPVNFAVIEPTVFDEAFKRYLSLYLSNAEIELINNGFEPLEPKVNNSTVIDYYVVADVNYNYQAIELSKVYDKSELIRLLIFGEDYQEETYTVKVGDSLTNIARENNVGINDLVIANENIVNEDTLIAVGEKLKIVATAPIIPVFTQKHEKSEAVIPFEIKYVDDPNRYTTEPLLVKVEGKNGKQLIESNKLYVNGIETSDSNIIKIEDVDKAVDKVVVRGTKKYVNPNVGGIVSGAKWLTPPAGSLKGTGSWIRPSNGEITSIFYDPRTGRMHRAVDYANRPEGTPNKAADSGYVVYRGYNPGGEGYYVIINHGNGYYTKYAHCSSRYPIVSLGTNIYQGETVCGMGNSGKTYGRTGIHLHFQVLNESLRSIDPFNLSSVFK